MRFLMILGLLMTSGYASEVATLQFSKPTKEYALHMSDDVLLGNFEKYFMTHPCRPRSSTNLNLNMRENFIPMACRASVTKFFLDNGYKLLDERTFIKQ